MNSKEIMVNLMVEKICEYIDADEVHKIVVHGKEFAEVKKGKWIRDFDGNEFHTYCSNCNEEFYEEELWTVGDEQLPNYCPLCGADMREANDE